MAFKKGQPRPAGAGRKKGSPNKLNASVKEMVLEALGHAGGVEYLTKVAQENPQIFCSLLGRVLPTQIEGGDNPVHYTIVTGVPRANRD